MKIMLFYKYFLKMYPVFNCCFMPYGRFPIDFPQNKQTEHSLRVIFFCVFLYLLEYI